VMQAATSSSAAIPRTMGSRSSQAGRWQLVLRGFEDRLERMVEGVFARAFRSGLQPVEIGRRLVREIDAGRRIDVNGRTLAPNCYQIRVSPEDHQRFVPMEQSLIAELANTVREHAGDTGLSFLGPVTVDLASAPNLKVGTFKIHPKYDETVAPAVINAWLETPDGQRHRIGGPVATIGRVTDCDIAINDPNVSRHHAELHTVGDSIELVDLGSTNGCKVNGRRVGRQPLNDGDQVTFGAITLRFRRA